MASHFTLAQHSTGYILIADSQIYFEVSGQGDAVVFIHGGFTLVTMNDVAHMPNVEKPEEFRRLLFGFLDQH